MKAALFAVAFGAFFTVRAAEDESAEVPAGQSPEQAGADAQALFEEADSIDWERYSPQVLGMKLNFEEMSEVELDRVVDGFVQLGLIDESERPAFKDSLTNPAMRDMIEKVQENWGTTMTNIMRDPKFIDFLKTLRGGIDEGALGRIVGFEGGISEVVKRHQEEQDANEGDDDEFEGSGSQQQQ